MASQEPSNEKNSERESLEIEKLKLDIEHLRHPVRTSLRKIDWKDIATVVVAVLGITVAWYAGVFEVRQQRIAASTDRLSIERINLERSNAELLKTKTELGEEARRLEVKIRDLQDQVGSYEKERAAIKAINEINGKSDLLVRISLSSDSDHFEVSIEPSNIAWNTIGTPNEQIAYYPAIRTMLKEMRYIQRLKTLRIGCLELTDSEMKEIGELQQLEELYLGHAKLTDEMLEPLVNLPKLIRLGIADKRIRNPKPLRKLPTIEILYLSGTSLDDDGLSTVTSIHSLLKLWADQTNITDAGIEHINTAKRLVLIGLRKTKITPSGCLKLGLQTLRSLEVSPGFMPEVIKEQLRKQLPDLFVNDTYDPDSLSSLPDAKIFWRD
jgi:hypothetical protein